MNVLVLGATGMLGHAVFQLLSERLDWVVHGTVRNADVKKLFPVELSGNLVLCKDLKSHAELTGIFNQLKPDIVINCISIAKELLASVDTLNFIQNYSLFPQHLSWLCKESNARLVQISSDGVFSGKEGAYVEGDFPDAEDIYGISKLLGEVYCANAITIRTSIIGHELESKSGLLEWFLAQKNSCNCFTRAIFSGLPTVVLAQVIRDIIIPSADLSGLYHIASKPISKFELLSLVARRYNKNIRILADDRQAPDRSLSAEKFERDTGYVAPEWPELIDTMYSYQLSWGQ
ncbi:MAG: SDR family oxidoreductase [Gammaproteobacteria bacterium]|nr:SDR family oxidoreductase [Gammaproteobacteria bacterium]